MRIHQIRNATLKIDFGGKTFLIDPMFAPKDTYPPITDKTWPFCDLPIPVKDIIKNIDAVIITHIHIDHFDKYAEEVLPKSTKIFVQDIFDKNALEKSHFNNIEVLTEEGNNFEGIKLHKTECRHGIRELAEPMMLANGMRWEAMGVVFESDREQTLYLAGDTIWYNGVKETIDKYNPEYIIVNAACAQTPKSGPIIMGIEDIKELHNYAPEIKIIGSHLDCVGHATLSRYDIRKSEVKDFIYLPADGEIITIED